MIDEDERTLTRSARISDSLEADPGTPTARADQDWALVDLARCGDSAAFSQLYQGNKDAVFGYVSRRIKDWALAEDVTSETFLHAYSKIGSVSHRGSSFRAWVMTIARNLVLDHFRSARHRREVLSPDTMESPSAELEPAVEVCLRAAAAELRRGMDDLTGDQRECLARRFFDQLSVHEVAVTMRRTDESVRSLQARAVRRLGGILSRERVGL